MPDPIIKQRIEQLPPLYKAYVLSDMPEVIAQTFGQAHSLPEEGYIVLENGLALYLLFFLDQSGFTDFLMSEIGFDEKNASLLVAAMHSALPEDIQEIHDEISRSIFTSAPVSSNTSTTILSEIAETEAALEHLSRLRTMATDGKQVGYAGASPTTPPPSPETTYTSMQSAILHEGEAK